MSPEEARKALKDAQGSSGKKPDAAQRSVPKRSNVLPDQFAAWKAISLKKFGPYNAATLAGADAPVLLEYQYQNGEQRQYRDGARKLTAEAFRMKDSSGAYGLFTYYRGEDWEPGNIEGTHVAWRGEQTLLRKGEAFVRLSGARLSPNELAALASDLGLSGGGPLPTLPGHLPEKGLVGRSSKYAYGPEVLSRIMPGLPQGLIDFNLEPEMEVAEYNVAGKPRIKLLLVSYPTSQTAASKMKKLESGGLGATGNQHIFARRAGPILAFALTTGSQAEADRLLSQVNYSADVVWNEPVETNDVPKFREFLINVLLLIGAWLLFAMAAGLLFGLLRVIVKKQYPEQVFDRPEEAEVIQLHISH